MQKVTCPFSVVLWHELWVAYVFSRKTRAEPGGVFACVL